MRLKHEHSKHSMSLSAYGEEGSRERLIASPVQPAVATGEVVTNDEDWLDMTEEQAECARWGHWEGVLEVCDFAEDGSIVRDERGEVVWYAKEYKGVCAKCGAKRRVL